MKQKLQTLLLANNLYTNSFFLMASSGIAYLTGFLFWLIVARIYSTPEIGTATVIFSIASLISSLSLLGFNTSLLKYLPEQFESNEKINSSILITATVSGFLALIVLLSSPFYFHSLNFVRENMIYVFFFILFTVISSLNLLSDSIFIAFRASFHVFIKILLQSFIKLLLPFFLVTFGAFGIFMSLYIGVLASITYTVIILVLLYGLKYKLQLHIASIKTMTSISFGTYVSGMITIIPSFLLPLFISSLVGDEATAFYFIAATTANVIYIIPQIITQNLLVEGSYQEDKIKILTRKTSYFLFSLLIPSIFIMILFGDYILVMFGKSYSVEGLSLLRLMAFSGIFVGVNYIFGTLLTLYHHIKLLILINFIGTLFLLTLSYFFLYLGITGIGVATLLTQIVLILLYTGALYKTGKIYLVRSLF